MIGSALHWFDRPAADHEIARVLRPGGVVGVFSNRRDKSVAWVADARTTCCRANTSMREPSRPPDRDQPTLRPGLVRADRRSREFPFSQVLDADGLAELYASRSYVIDMAEADRSALMARIRELARTHPDLAGRDTFEVPYSTVVHAHRVRFVAHDRERLADPLRS